MISGLKNVLKTHLPEITSFIVDGRGMVRGFYYQYMSKSAVTFECPICKYRGPFLDHGQTEGQYSIHFTMCPRCELLERHRLQFLVMKLLFDNKDFSDKSILHFAPERKFAKFFKNIFGTHHTTDICEVGVDYTADICNLPFKDNTYDVVFASHVMEHVKDDRKALSEIKRVLKKDGMAILPVPVVSSHTIEYPEPNVSEFGHVRAIGPDYFQLYEKYFNRVEVYSSEDFDAGYQLYTYEDRSIYPTVNSPLRVSIQGEKHLDYVPVCYL